MIGLEDRQFLSQDIGVAHAAGARLHLACDIAGIDVRTLQRWKAHAGLTAGDGRPQAVRPLPSHALSDAERAELVRVANEARFAAVPPAHGCIWPATSPASRCTPCSAGRLTQASQRATAGRRRCARCLATP